MVFPVGDEPGFRVDFGEPVGLGGRLLEDVRIPATADCEFRIQDEGAEPPAEVGIGLDLEELTDAPVLAGDGFDPEAPGIVADAGGTEGVAVPLEAVIGFDWAE